MPNTNTAKKVKTKYTKAKLKKELPLGNVWKTEVDRI